MGFHSSEFRLALVNDGKLQTFIYCRSLAGKVDTVFVLAGQQTASLVVGVRLEAAALRWKGRNRDRYNATELPSS